MTNSNVWRASRISANALGVLACLGASSGSTLSQERLPPNPAAIKIFDPDDGSLPDGSNACDATYGYLIEELVTQRLESARLSIELAQAKAEGAEIQRTSRQQEALLSAMMAAMASRDRQAALRSGAADLRQRLEAAQAELQRQRAENDRLAAALAAAYKAADAATVMAQDNLAVINAQIRALNAGAGNVDLARAERPAELVSAVWVNVVPAIPRQKSHLKVTR
jgi:hypothetical protein